MASHANRNKMTVFIDPDVLLAEVSSDADAGVQPQPRECVVGHPRYCGSVRGEVEVGGSVREVGTVIWDQIGVAPKSVLGIGSLVVALLIGSAPMMSSGWSTGFIIAAILLAVLVMVVSLAQDARDRRRGNELDELRAEHEECSSLAEKAARQAAAAKDAEYLDYLAWLCKDRLAMLQHQITACFSAMTAAERRMKISKARTSILNATAELVGNGDKGTRANIFKLVEAADGSEEMVPDGFWGRGDQSTRVFRPGMATFDEARAGRSRFRAQIDRVDSDTGEQLTYETYLAFPIKEGTGTLYGILTVDCLREGELSKDLDTARMSVLAAMQALTYRAAYVRPMPSPA